MVTPGVMATAAMVVVVGAFEYLRCVLPPLASLLARSFAMEFPGLTFSSGLKLHNEVRLKLRVPVPHPVVDRFSFALVVAFGRCKFKLSASSAGVLLQATIGGEAAHFAVSQLGERTFKFWVSTKTMGFFVANLRSFACDSFRAYFFLWGNGGFNWRHEFALFLEEEAKSWVAAATSSKRKSFAGAVKSSPLTGANAVPLMTRRLPAQSSSAPARRSASASARRSVFERILFPPATGRSTATTKSQTVQCSRCLFTRHWHASCHWPIRCCACRRTGHIAAVCVNGRDIERGQDPNISKGKEIMEPEDGWRGPDVNTHAGPSSTRPPTSTAASQCARRIWAAKVAAPELTAPGASRPNTVQKGQTAIHHTINEIPALEGETHPASSSPSLQCAATMHREENPPPELQYSPLITPPPHTPSAVMAYQHTDPAPFIPEGLRHEDIPNREFMVRAVAPVRPPARNEDLAIVTFEPLPGNPMHFGAVRGVIRDFLRDEMRVPFEDIQPSNLGQALVRLTHTYHRDVLVRDSPHVYDNVTVTF